MPDYVKGDKRAYRDSLIIGDQEYTGDDVLNMTPGEFERMDPTGRMMMESWLEAQEAKGKITVATRFVHKILD